MRRISTTSSATSRWPRSIRSSAHSDLPIPLSPTMRTPRPKTSMSTECRWRRRARRSSRNAERALMNGVDSADVTRTGMPRASASAHQLRRRIQPLRHHEAGDRGRRPGGAARTRAARRDSLRRYPSSLAAQDLHAAVTDVVGVAGEGEARAAARGRGSRRGRARPRPRPAAVPARRRDRAARARVRSRPRGPPSGARASAAAGAAASSGRGVLRPPAR